MEQVNVFGIITGQKKIMIFLYGWDLKNGKG